MQLFLLSLFLFFQATPQDTVKVNTSVKEATVYLDGAEVNRSSAVNLQQGTNYITFGGLSSSLNEESIGLQTEGDIILESISKSLDRSFSAELNTKMENLQNQKQKIEDAIKQKQAALKVLDQKLNVLLTNQDISGENVNISAAELEQTINYFGEQFEEIETRRIIIADELEAVNEELAKINRTINSIERQRQRASGVIEIAIYSETPQQTSFDLSYFVPGVRWYPSYDVRVDETDGPIDLTYKARIIQRTGVDWNDVELTVSSVNPKFDLSIPTIRPVSLDFYTPPQRQNQYSGAAKPQFDLRNLRTAGEAGITNISGVVRDAETGEPIPSANVYIPEVQRGAAAELNGRYAINNVPPGAKTLRVTFVGYQTYVTPINSSVININLEQGNVGLDELVVTGFGSEINEEQTAFSFKIENPYTIRNDESKTVPVDSYEIPASYEFLTIPKKEPKAFLVANINDWESLNLLQGEASLFLDQSFVGKTNINPSTVQDTLTFSLGEDEGIVVERKQIETFKEKNFFGNKVTETNGWDITLRNTKSTAITITVLDQIPLSSNEDIEIDLKEQSGATFNESTGQLKWTIELASAESRTLRFVYETTYPSDKQLIEN